MTLNRLESALPCTTALTLLGNREIQTLIRGNFVCFPSQAPVFGERSRRNLQWRLAVLYFVQGWPARVIAARYGLRRERCGQIISDWRIRAVALGYIQDVTPEGTDLMRLVETCGAAERMRPSHDWTPRAATGVPSNNTMSRTSFAISAAVRQPSILR